MELQGRGVLVAFTGVEGPLGGSRGKRYRQLCQDHGVILIPDILDGILSDDSLRSDQIHPNGDGYKLMAQRVADVIAPYLNDGEQ